jgi:uncharacterized membrane protein YgaE (UPF0421/DUF939 family)
VTSARTILVDVRRRVREGGQAAAARALRLTLAAVAAFLAARWAGTESKPVTAALTALLIVQVTFYGTLAETMRRVVSVVIGVGVAVTAASFVGFTWWSLGLIVLVSILIGQALRLGPHLLEVPISAMLILAAGGAGIRATDRVIETLIGAGVGVLVSVLVPQRPRTRSAGMAVERFGDSIAGLLDRVSSSLQDSAVGREEAMGWLDDLRAITARAEQVEREVDEARESRRLNPRAAGVLDTTPDLRSGLQALEHAAVALRSVFRSLADGAGVTQDESRPDGSGDEPLREALAVLMADLARAVRDFATLVRAEGDEAGEQHTDELADALDAVREARVRLTELLLIDPREAVGLWQLRGALLAGVERVLAELDAEERRRNTARRREEAAAQQRRAALAAQRLRTTTRKVVADNPAIKRAAVRPRERRPDR